MKDEKVKTIKCPYCDREYLPGEIFLPKNFLGQPTYIEKDFSGAIIYNQGIEQELKESYVCDKCNKKFNIVAEINYEITKDILYNMDEAYISKREEDKLFLKEE